MAPHLKIIFSGYVFFAGLENYAGLLSRISQFARRAAERNLTTQKSVYR